MAIDFDLVPAQPFRITLPTTATVNDAGEVVVDLTANASQAEADAAAAQATADQAVIDAAAAQATADAAVANSDIQPLPTARVDLINTATGSVVRFIPLFAGTLATASLVLDGATTAVGACSVAITIDGVAVVLAAPLSRNAASAAGSKVTTTVSSGGAFTANQTIEVTTTSANTAATFGSVNLGATRA